jgi:SAM-dependent methyltransferase
MTSSMPFDRIADRYDETRGGLERGGNLARSIATHLRPGPVAEVGVGTAAVALPLTQIGHPVIGFDLSLPMLRRAHERLGSQVAQADGYHLPIRGGAVPNVAIVWVLQLVPDVAGLLAEVRRLLSPGGRLVVVPAGGQYDNDDIEAVMRPLNHALRPPRDQPDQVSRGAAAGLTLVEHTTAQTEPWNVSPEDQARSAEARSWSTLWDVPDDKWTAVVEPAIAALRALPEPTRPRVRRTRYDILAFAPA